IAVTATILRPALTSVPLGRVGKGAQAPCPRRRPRGVGFAEPVIGPATSGRTRWLSPPFEASRQLVVALAESLQAHGEADAFLRRLEDDEGRGLAVAQFGDQVVVHDHFGDAAVRQAAHEAGAADVVVVELHAETRWELED